MATPDKHPNQNQHKHLWVSFTEAVFSYYCIEPGCKEWVSAA